MIELKASNYVTDMFNFGDKFKDWIKLQDNTKYCVINVVWVSDWPIPSKGLKQGCSPFSVYLFVT